MVELDFNSLSDSEINRLIVNYYESKGISYFKRGNEIIEINKLKPCSEICDIFGIIKKNGISLLYDFGSWEASIDYDGDLERDGTDEVLSFFYSNENPLRAACIVFLVAIDKGYIDG